MTLVRFTPARDLFGAHNRLNQIFNTMFSDQAPGLYQETGTWAPEVDVEETVDAIVLRADLPGMSKKNMHIAVEDGRLTISGERKNEVSEEGKNFHRIERTYGSFCRSFTLPATVLGDKVEATYRDGVLKVTVPKAEEVKPREIEIKM
jgi:HSP20 family protein